jgi:hypothetical protein
VENSEEVRTARANVEAAKAAVAQKDFFPGESPAHEVTLSTAYYIGAIVAKYRTGWMDFGTIARIKRVMYGELVYEQSDSILNFRMYGDFSDVPADLRDTNPRTPVTQRVDHGIIDMSGDDEDSAHPRGRTRVPLGGIRRTHVAWELYDERPRNPWTLYDVGLDMNFGED